jgi:beta-galactosidase
VLTPELHVLPDTVAGALNDFVKRGGVLMADCRTGVKDETNLCHERTLPGLLSDSLGVSIEEYEAIANDMEYEVVGKGDFEGKFSVIRYADWTRAVKAETLAGFGQWHLKKFAALTRNRYGKGTAYYVGAVVKEDAFYDKLIAELLKTARVRPVARPPAGVEVSVRQGKGRKLLFVINHTEERKTVKVPEGKRELITGKKTGKTLTLGEYGVAVIGLAL